MKFEKILIFLEIFFEKKVRKNSKEFFFRIIAKTKLKTTIQRGFGFIRFETYEAQKRAMEEKDHEIQGRQGNRFFKFFSIFSKKIFLSKKS